VGLRIIRENPCAVPGREQEMDRHNEYDNADIKSAIPKKQAADTDPNRHAKLVYFITVLSVVETPF
jgi:hypothetical protein